MTAGGALARAGATVAPDSAEPACPPDAVEVGRILGAWGVKGAIKVRPLSADPQALFSSRRWYLQASSAKPGQKVPTLLRITQVREQGDAVLAVAQGLDDRDAAQALAGASVRVSRASFPSTADGEYYWVDLIGLRVCNRAGLCFGHVVGLVETGPHCVLRVRSDVPESAETLIPFVAAYVDEVDMRGGEIRVDWQADFAD